MSHDLKQRVVEALRAEAHDHDAMGVRYHEQRAEALRALASSLENCAIVPVEPTEEMLGAGRGAICDDLPTSEVYRAMLEAAK